MVHYATLTVRAKGREQIADELSKISDHEVRQRVIAEMKEINEGKKDRYL